MNKTIKLKDGKTAWFSSANLRSALRSKKEQLEQSGEKCSQQMMMEDIAEQTGISFSAIKHWCAGHNAPSDPDKVQDLADALGVEMNYLLEFNTEDFSNMNTCESTINKNIDYSSVKSAVRSIYTNMASFIELFRMASVVGTHGMELKPLFLQMYGSLMYARLDISQETFQKLCSFSVNYLQQFGSYLHYTDAVYTGKVDIPLNNDHPHNNAHVFVLEYTHAYHDSWYDWSSCLSMTINPTSEDCQLFEDAMNKQYELDNNEAFIADVNEVIIDCAYARLEEILADYMIR